jgi:hypothetical protein
VWFGGFQSGGLRRDCALVAVIEQDFGGDSGNRFDAARAILRMPDALVDVEGFDFHQRNLSTSPSIVAMPDGQPRRTIARGHSLRIWGCVIKLGRFFKPFKKVPKGEHEERENGLRFF